MLKNRELPQDPGVYLFKAGEKVLYIGKAKNLKKRVAQYFLGRDHLVINNLLEQADDLETIVTENERDALLLEYNLVHTYQPPFNVRLKDDKSYPLVQVTLQDPFPGVFYSRRREPKQFHVGPLTNSGKARALIDVITRLFKLRVCTSTAFNRGTSCLYFYIDRCSAPCTGNISPEEYNKNVEDAVSLLKGKRGKILKKLGEKMSRLAENLEFEAAQRVKEDIELLHQFSLDSYISSGKQADYDVIAFHYHRDQCFIVLFTMLEGRVMRKEFFDFNTLAPGPEEALTDFLLSFYSGRQSIPPEIVLRAYPEDKEPLEELFSEVAGRRVSFKLPLKGDKRKMLDLAAQNLNLFVGRTNYAVIGRRLKEQLKLQKFPYWIEGYDISHFSERDRVGAMVAFSQGKPDRKKYRSYIIKKAQPGDTEALKEVLERRFKKTAETGEYPDLLLIDGGKGQLSAALEIKEKLNIQSDIIALAKEEERIFMEPGGSHLFPQDSPERFLLQNIRDEVHRRAITHHRKRREKLPKK